MYHYNAEQTQFSPVAVKSSAAIQEKAWNTIPKNEHFIQNHL